MHCYKNTSGYDNGVSSENHNNNNKNNNNTITTVVITVSNLFSCSGALPWGK